MAKEEKVTKKDFGFFTKKVMPKVNGKFSKKDAVEVRTGMYILKSYAEQENANDNGIMFVEEKKSK